MLDYIFSVEFGSWSWLLLLPIVPISFFWLAKRSLNRAYTAFSMKRFGDTAHAKRAVFFPFFACALLALALAIGIFSLAQPQVRVPAPPKETVETRDILLVLDLSLSMEGHILYSRSTGSTEGEGTSPSDSTMKKIDFIREFARKLVWLTANGVSGDRIGVFIFGDKAFTAMPFTSDYTLALHVLDEIDTSLPTDLRGTDIADAFFLSLYYLNKLEGSAPQIVIFLTDGLDTANKKILPEIKKLWADTSRERRLVFVGLQLPETSEYYVFCKTFEDSTCLNDLSVAIGEGIIAELEDIPRGSMIAASGTFIVDTRLTRVSAFLSSAGILFWVLIASMYHFVPFVVFRGNIWRVREDTNTSA